MRLCLNMYILSYYFIVRAFLSYFHSLYVAKRNTGAIQPYSRITPGNASVITSIYNNSIAIAVASPPPIHKDATPRFLRCCFNAWINVTRIRAPEAPMGWPNAQAPP